MDPGELLTVWTARLALALYAAGLALRLGAAGRRAWARRAWTVGYGLFLLHVACAFQFYHHWSHRAVYEATARQASEAVGLAWGGGLYANYAFALVWGADVAWWLSRPAAYVARPAVAEWAVQGFLAFMAVNATVVFGRGATRGAGLAACAALAAVALTAARRRAGRRPG
jgi:hypothetical protein